MVRGQTATEKLIATVKRWIVELRPCRISANSKAASLKIMRKMWTGVFIRDTELTAMRAWTCALGIPIVELLNVVPTLAHGGNLGNVTNKMRRKKHATLAIKNNA